MKFVLILIGVFLIGVSATIAVGRNKYYQKE